MRKALIVITAFILASPFVAARGQDVREAARKAAEDARSAERRAAEVEKRILEDRTALRAEVERLESREAELSSALQALESRIASGKSKMERLEEKWAGMELEFKEISGNVRVVARDVETMLKQSPLTAVYPDRLKRIAPLLRQGYFPDIDDISGMCGVLLGEMEKTGQVAMSESPFVARDGRTRTAEILSIGPFTTVYRSGDETGFCTYSPESGRLFALSALPPGWMQKSLKEYLDGGARAVPMDISAGAALRQVTHQISLIDQIRAGGPIVWPIAVIALAALLIIVYKIFFLRSVHGSTGKIMDKVNRLAARGDWEACEDFVRKYEGRQMPVIQVVQSGLQARDEDRETLESVLQESILREMPRVERGLSLLAVFGAVAPLLGLLGTVTGMIDTFRVITLFGTGDPKLMSGGISEALVTTELGLAVAIPIMLMHTFLSRRASGIIGEMEEKAVYLTNIIQKVKKHGGSADSEEEVKRILDGVGK